MTGDAFDWAALVYASVVILIITIGAVLYVRYANDHVLKARNVPMLVVMSIGADFHIVSEIVSNRHLDILTQIEITLCPLWGYWIPYVFGAGLFFTGLYLRLFTYTTAISRDFSERSAACALRMRIPIAMATLLPICIICLAATFLSDGSHVVNGHCESSFGYKIAVCVWMSVALFALVLSVISFRSGFISDIVGETSKQIFVAGLGVIVIIAVGFVLIFAESGLEEVWNRALTTFSISTLYLWALGVLGIRPLWKVLRGDTSYRRVFEEQVDKMQQPLESVVRVVKQSGDKVLNRLIVGDFLTFCAAPVRFNMDRGKGRTTKPADVVLFYSMLDAWTYRMFKALALESGNEDYTIFFEDMPPLLSDDIVRTSDELIQRWFTNEGAPMYTDLTIPSNVRTEVTHKHHVHKDPVDTFRDAMWWGLELLDEFYGAAYIDVNIRGRDVYLKDGVKELLDGMRCLEARRRIEAAQLIQVRENVNDASSSEEVEPQENIIELANSTTTGGSSSSASLNIGDTDDAPWEQDPTNTWNSDELPTQNGEVWKGETGGVLYLSNDT